MRQEIAPLCWKPWRAESTAHPAGIGTLGTLSTSAYARIVPVEPTLLDKRPRARHVSGMPDETSQRLERLELHIAHLEHQVEQLNGVIIAQGKLLDWLRKEVHRQSGAMQSLELERMKSNTEKPPHYQ